MKILIQVVIAALVASVSLGEPYESRFTDLKLPLGVSIKVPKNWWLLNSELNSTIETAGEAVLNLTDIGLPTGKKVILFRANSTPRTTYASITIDATDSDINPQELRSASDAELASLAPEMRDLMKQDLTVQGLDLIEFYGTRLEFVSGHPAFVIEYLRSGQNGPVFVQLTRLFLGPKEISVSLSYRQSEAPLWKPVITYVRQSFVVSTR